ncbi:small heat shock protein OV25-1-like [Daphnia carinata]|uniref:small heat shock protein OV25-1-like n=1 Tax=Daphnia carinata TaxID=120202 RepID=UPI00257DF5CA|nr:small heat shock protein OV25-1-like [Daphnia carinata]
MALWNYDPFSDFFSMGTPRSMDPWGFSRMDPFSRWGEPPLSSLLTPDLYIIPTVVTRRQQQNREVISDKDKYQVTLNLGDFKSNEINVKLVDRALEICAEHKEKPDETGHISRNIRRRYILPRNVDFEHLNATLSDNGTLVVCATKKPIEPGNERTIEVKQLPPQSQQQQQQPQQTAPVTQKTEQETGKGSINIPVSHE